MKKVYIKTLGCQINEYDSNIILNILYRNHKLEETLNMYDADILILNTCSVRDKVDSKSLSELGTWKKIKEYNSNIIICICGCFAYLNSKFFIKNTPFVDIIFSPKTIHEISNMLTTFLETKKKIIQLEAPILEKFNYVYENKTHSYSSSITIMEGCNKFCTYCIVPFSRGKEISRSFNSIISEIYSKIINGSSELILLGQNVTSYYNLINNSKFIDFPFLLDYTSRIEGINRLKFISSHPSDFTSKLIDIIKNNEVISKHIHLPLQSGSNKILRLMNRSYDIKYYKDIFNELKSNDNSIFISTDIIIGFPGETDKDFEETFNIFDELKFDNSYIYIYSDRPGTLSFNMADKINNIKKKSRLERLNKLLDLNRKYINNSMVGKIYRVIIYKIVNNICFGKTDNNRSVVFKDHYFNVGKSVLILINHISNNIFYGKSLK
jgi:tRNA-2-methylthio-N6-dimethylallyladenosine synthase